MVISHEAAGQLGSPGPLSPGVAVLCCQGSRAWRHLGVVLGGDSKWLFPRTARAPPPPPRWDGLTSRRLAEHLSPRSLCVWLAQASPEQGGRREVSHVATGFFQNTPDQEAVRVLMTSLRKSHSFTSATLIWLLRAILTSTRVSTLSASRGPSWRSCHQLLLIWD